jgi:hypothetical protein
MQIKINHHSIDVIKKYIITLADVSNGRYHRINGCNNERHHLLLDTNNLITNKKRYYYINKC